MFDGFSESVIDGAGARIFCRVGGDADAPPLLLLHGYPQTSAMWHRVAPALAREFRVVAADLRGYGRSDKPAGGADHVAYSKRAMAADMIAVMAALGHDRFAVLAHDRGARVAHRMGMDHPDAVQAMTLLDIAPTREMYAGTTEAFARSYWHWFFLILPAPLPETMIGADPEAYFRGKVLNQTGRDGPFSQDALAEYMAAFSDPDTIHASCEDYRAAAGIDLLHDEAEDGARLSMPLQVLWADRGVMQSVFDTLSLWRLRADKVDGQPLPGGHYLAEESPQAVLDAALPFLRRHTRT